MTWFITEMSKLLFGREVVGLLQGIQFKTQPYIQGNPI